VFNFNIPSEERSDMVNRLITVLLVAALFTIALCTVPSRREFLVTQLVYSYAISILIWLFIDVGDMVVFKTAGKRFPFTKNRYIFAFFALIVGHFFGTMIGDWYSGWSLLIKEPQTVLMWNIVIQVVTFGLIWLFTQRNHHKEDRRSTYDTRLRLLESQLEPHMLFNTLANLRALVSTDPIMATQMLDRIVDYMRATLGGSRATMHPLSAEFERLDDYLDLMKMRMGNRLSYSLYLSPELKNYPVPPFILQPLAENAIKHGLEPKVEGGRIFIKADIVNKRVLLEVNDTGSGVHPDDLINSNGFGWTQVSERLIATYGHHATINLVATEAYKTTAKITFPYIEQYIETRHERTA
jgi:Histidine kinase